jgi:hypothetical protein
VKLSNGMYDLDRGEYDAIDRLNWSTLKILGKSPMHYHQRKLAPPRDTDSMRLGRATHLATFEPEKYRSACVVWEDRRAGNAYKAFVAKHSGKEVLTVDQHAESLAIASAARRDPIAAPYLSGGRGEQTMLFTLERPGLPDEPGTTFECKGRLDFVSSEGCIVDLKTTKNASPSGFSREAANFEYHAQAAWYSDGYKATTGRTLPYVIVAVENFEPYVVTVFTIPPPVIEVGRRRYRELLDTLAFCRRESRWPGYCEAPVELELPPWLLPDDESAEGLDLVVNN